jgi:hypothetical protein
MIGTSTKLSAMDFSQGPTRDLQIIKARSIKPPKCRIVCNVMLTFYVMYMLSTFYYFFTFYHFMYFLLTTFYHASHLEGIPGWGLQANKYS